MWASSRSRLWGYGIAIASVLVALGLTLLFRPATQRIPFIFFYAALTVSAGYGGLGPGVLSTVLAVLLVDYLFFPPLYTFGFVPDDLLPLGLFVVTAIFISSFQSQRRRAEQTAHDQRERYRVTLSSIGDAVIATDIQGAVTFMNPVAERLTGWVQRDAKGTDVHRVFHIVNEQTRQPVENPIVRVLREGTMAGLANHTLLITKNGQDRPIDDSSAPIKDEWGNVSGAILVFRDMTERQNADQRRRESEQRYRSLFENMLNGLAYCKMEFDRGQPSDFVYLEVNRAFEALTGLNNVVGKKVTEVIPGIRESDPALFEIYGRVALSGQPERFETYVISLDMWFSIAVYSPAREYFVAVFDVITERKRAEARNQELNQALAQHNTELEQRVAERTQQLQQAMERAQAADQAKTIMLSNVSHEMRTPLSSITGFSNLLLSRHLEADKQRQFLTAINEEGWRLTTLVEDFLDLQRIESGRQVFRFTCTDLGALIQDTLLKQSSLDKTQRIRLTVEPASPVQADSDRIRQVLLNLVSNALKFSDGEIEVSLRQEAKTVHVAVRDEGMGISPLELGQLFQLFQRGETAERERIRGTGLGLALCKQIVEAHQGRIWAESAGEGQGATFHFTLPVA